MALNKPSKPCKKPYRESKTENPKLRQTITIQETRIQALERRHIMTTQTPRRRTTRRAGGQEAGKKGKKKGGQAARGTGGIQGRHQLAQAHRVWDACTRGVPAVRLRRPEGHGHELPRHYRRAAAAKGHHHAP